MEKELDTHVDFMIGSKDVSITGKDAALKEYLIIQNGNFVLEEKQ